MSALHSATAALGAFGETAGQVVTWVLLVVWFVAVTLFVLGDETRRRSRP